MSNQSSRDFFKNLQKNKAIATEKENESKALAAKYLDSGCDKDDKKDAQGAIEDYTKALEIYPKYAEAYANRGCTKEELGDNKGALSDWYEAVDLGDKEAANWIKETKDKYEMTPELQSTQKRFEEIANKEKQEGGSWLFKQVRILQPEDLTLLIELDKEADPEQVSWYNKHPGLVQGGLRHTGVDLEEAATRKQMKVIEKYYDLIEQLELDFWKAALAKELQEFLRDWEDDFENGEIIIYDSSGDGRFCYKDDDHGGSLFVPKRLILADADFYTIEDWCDVDEEDFEHISFSEPMMTMYVNNVYCVDDVSINIDDSDFLKWHGARLSDLHEDSCWHEG